MDLSLQQLQIHAAPATKSNAIRSVGKLLVGNGTIELGILTGLGVTERSVTVPSIAPVKAHLPPYSLADIQTLAQRTLQCRSAQEVRAL